jgi:hypothetical protein
VTCAAAYLHDVNLFTRKTELVGPNRALPGRDEPMAGLGPHRVLGTPITPPFPDATEQAVFGMGCFWEQIGPSDPYVNAESTASKPTLGTGTGALGARP